jgi:Family of unknown function (DUF6527)
VRLIDLEPRFVRYEEGGIRDSRITALAEAQGLWFLCPLCFAQNHGPVGTHTCETTFEGRGALPEQGSHNKEGKPTRWNVSGTNFQNLTLSPSIQLQGGCNWHGFITNGEIK